MYKYESLSPATSLQRQPLAGFGRPPRFYSDGDVRREVTPIPSPGSGGSTVQLISPKPGVSDLVDYLDATVRVRGRVTVPTQKVNFLVKLDPPGKPTWWKRLWEDPLKVFPTVRVTIELLQVGVSLYPLSHYRRDLHITHGFQEYLLRLHSKKPACSIDYVPALGGLFSITTQAAIESELGISGQLNTLLKAANIKLPMTAQDQQRHFWMVYATFPPEIAKYLIPEDRVLVDEFELNKATLTQRHIGKIIAIARQIAAMAKAAAPPAIALTGHTDDRGTEKHNVDLGGRRAAAVTEALRKAIDGISPGLSTRITITSKSFGESKPLTRATTEPGHARNRRVEVLLPKLRPRCPRVPLRDVVARAFKLLPRLGSRDQALRLNCVLRKVIQKGTDDRWVGAPLVLHVFNATKLPGTYGFPVLRDHLSVVESFGPAVPDAQFLKNLERMDELILEGRGEVIKLIKRLTPAATQGINMPNTLKAADGLRAWMFERTKSDQSIYSCYRK